nr:MAG TPA: putative transcriptional regulator [Caudoviricetes sp.]
MTDRYIGIAGFAALTGLTRNTVTAYRRKGTLPTPDVVIEEAGRATTSGWTEDTIRQWMRERDAKRGRPSIVYWALNTDTGAAAILTEGMPLEDLSSWIDGTQSSETHDLARKLLAHKPSDMKTITQAGFVIRSASRRATVPPGVSEHELWRLAADNGITCVDADKSQIATVLAHACPQVYGELLLAHTA